MALQKFGKDMYHHASEAKDQVTKLVAMCLYFVCWGSGLADCRAGGNQDKFGACEAPGLDFSSLLVLVQSQVFYEQQTGSIDAESTDHINQSCGAARIRTERAPLDAHALADGRCLRGISRKQSLFASS